MRLIHNIKRGLKIEALKMISGKQHGPAGRKKNNQRAAFKRADILTDEELYKLTTSERLEYV